MAELLIQNGVIITVNAGREIIENGYILVEHGKIVQIGPMEQLPPGVTADKVLDVAGNAMLPGLIDTHAHGGHGMTRSLGEHLEDGWETMAEGIYHRFSDGEFWRAEAALAAAERLKFGITTGVSMIGNTARTGDLEIIDAHIRGTIDTGIRHVAGMGCPNPPFPKTAYTWNGEDSFTEYTVTPQSAMEFVPKAMKAFHGKYALCDFISMPSRVGAAPQNSREQNIAQNKLTYAMAKEYGGVIHSHAFAGDMLFVQETTPEIFEMTLSLAHSTGMSPEEVAIMARHGVSVCHGPSTNANIMVRCPVTEMLKAGVNVTVASDASAPNRSYDLLKDIKIAQILQRQHFHDGHLIEAGKALEMITINGAKAIGKEKELGSLEVGKLADIIVLDVQQPHLAPFGIMPVQRLVYHATGADVCHTIVGGKVVMENRKLLTVSQQKVIADAAAAFDTMCRRSGVLEYAVNNPKLWQV